jgi:spermidine/putrescine transport system substrate-binding protein
VGASPEMIYRWLLGIFLLPGYLYAQQVVNVYNWTGYMSDDILVKFTQETGIHVNYSTFAGNDELFAKIASASDHSGYDVIVPSATFVARMGRLGMLQPLDKRKLTNFKNLNSDFLNKPFDPQNRFSIPYFWGSTGLVINRDYYPHLVFKHWQDLWDPALNDKILMIDESKTVFEIALKVLGYSPNSKNPQEIKAAYQKLLTLLPNIKLFNIVAPQSIYVNGDAGIGVGYNGDTYIAMQSNPALEYIYPEEGAFIWLDNMTIPVNAPHLENAYKFINFILRADIEAQIVQDVGYSSPNAAAVKLLPKDMQNNKVLYPDATIIKNATVENDTGDATQIYEEYWQRLKLGG